MVVGDMKTGGYSLIRDGFKYDWNYDETTGTKTKYYMAPATDFDKVSKRQIERYGLEKLGYETIAGKECLKVSAQKPIQATTWTWKGIPFKTVSKISNMTIVMEVVDFNQEEVDADIFRIPASVEFTER